MSSALTVRLAEEPQTSDTSSNAGLPPRPAPGERLARRLLLILAVISFLLLITLMAIPARQLKRVKVGDVGRTAIGRALEPSVARGSETARGEDRCGSPPAGGGQATGV